MLSNVVRSVSARHGGRSAKLLAGLVHPTATVAAAGFSSHPESHPLHHGHVDRKSADHKEPGYPIAGAPPVEWAAASEAIQHVKSGDNIYVHAFSSTPTILLNALCKHVLENDLTGIKLHHLLLEGETPWTAPELKDRIRSNSLFTGTNMRAATNDGSADYVPIFLSELPQLFLRNHIDIDVALIQVSPPDDKGFCSLGTSIDCTRAAVINANHIIAVANPNQPRTFGDGVMHESHIHTMVYAANPLYEHRAKPRSPEEETVGRLIADHLVEDGATLQMGIGNIPHACLAYLKNHRDMGIHTEMLADGFLDLVECSAVTNSRKVIHPGKICTSFAYGTKRLYEFLDDNPMIVMGDVSWVNDTSVIRRNPKVTAVNSAIEIDITGQVVSDSVGTRIVSGFGGQIDFIRAASLCTDGRGKPILAFTSTTKNGDSRIVSLIKTGGGVVTSRANVWYVVTEYGIAQLFSKSLRQRAYELIRIAHPDHREQLEKDSFARLKCMPSKDYERKTSVSTG